MNIFAVSNDPAECARALDDVRLRKMIVETAQLLSTALHEWGHPAAEYVYKPTHRNHPCAKWVRESVNNYDWTCRLFSELSGEYQRRTGKLHKSERELSAYFLLADDDYDGFYRWHEPFPNCSYYKQWDDVHEAYKQTLRDKWTEDEAKGRPPKWTNREQPEWR